ncbi:MAG: cytochrome c oxidase accessory protein CcoG [Pseudomonadota bacterium]
MSESVNKSAAETGTVTGIYQEHEEWVVNVGDKTVHAKRMPGFFRKLKNYTQFATWLPFFLVPYLRWNDKQAILFDIDNRQFHFFSLTVLPQDIWMLSLLLLLLAMTMFAVTSVASRVWCGFFCFQTVWTDWFTWLEEKIEGAPAARRKLDAAPWSPDKIRKKVIKHGLWIMLALLTGISFSIWFVDAFSYWNRLIHFDLPLIAWVVLIMFTVGSYYLAGFLREQTCMWLCPYARIQAVMADAQTVFPTYDYHRGEPRAKIRRGQAVTEGQGDCIDCFQCVQVCPTGVDIRQGQQLGCITCGLCLDACDSIMDKIGRPRGLIRYASLDEMEGRPVKKLYQHPRTISYLVILSLSLAGIIYGLTHIGSLTLRVEPERQPLFVQMSDGSIQNKYTFKVLNKTEQNIHVRVRVEGGVAGQEILGAEQPKLATHGKASAFTIFVRAPAENVKKETTDIEFYVENVEDPNMSAEYKTHFYGPRR